ncbi:Sulfate/thiosulfate import ATP-binding protein CysA [Thalassoglobus neptunius]|uniref:Sulfate/thiosulfate import ATP-binding protein CysA n=2 Tax=Thalassoglobus neptunius TaxID=1938619 RepID=A0A5C5WGP7_9PLAN|nr:Sulfate/thiosulfate import ATP-binding protein CysA [Thalassoglobus neptunius]
MVMDHFGIGFETGHHVIASDLELPIAPGSIVLFTGDSGAGKSSLMRAVRQQLEASDETVLDLDELANSEELLVNSFESPLEETLPLLARCGLGESQLMLRTPSELSAGQHYRFKLAQAISQKPDWIVADEFSATLDRELAKVVACNIRRICDQSNIGFLFATTHRDITEDLRPDLHVHCSLDGDIRIENEHS